MWQQWTLFSHGSQLANVMVGYGGLEGLFQPRCFYDSMSHCIVLKAEEYSLFYAK